MLVSRCSRSTSRWNLACSCRSLSPVPSSVEATDRPSMFGPSPCLRHYPERLATMPSADSCPISPQITSRDAMRDGLAYCFIRVESCRMNSLSDKPGRLFTGHPVRCSSQTSSPLAGQVSPDMSVNCCGTTASFTTPIWITGLCCLVATRPRGRPSMRFVSLGSPLCYGLPSDDILRHSLPQKKRDRLLPFTGGCRNFVCYV